MALWQSQDGFGYSSLAGDARQSEESVAAIATLADHNPSIDLSIEYKPNRPRAHMAQPDMNTTLLAMT